MTKNKLKIDQNLIKNWPKMTKKWQKNPTKIDQNSTKKLTINSSKIDQTWAWRHLSSRWFSILHSVVDIIALYLSPVEDVRFGSYNVT